jgi:hypothetical protein
LTLPSIRHALALAAVAVVTALTYARLYYGVDFTDESFYTAVSYRLVLGARPLVDETSVAQLPSSVLLYPFVKLYVAVAGLSGIVLYMRHLYFLCCAGTSLALFTALRRCRLDGALSATLATAPIAIVPFSIYGLSYNTFARNFFAVGCFFGVSWLADRNRRSLVFAGAGLGFAVFTYPPLGPAVACFFAALYFASRPRSVRALVPGLVAASVCCLATVAFFLQDGIGTARDLFGRASTYTGQGGSIRKAFDVASSVLSTFPHPYLAVVLVGAGFAFRRSSPWAATAFVAALPLTALPADFGSSASANAFVTNLALLAPAVFILTSRNSLAQRLTMVVWLPSAVAGEITAFTSSNGGTSFAIGFFPGAIVTGALIALFIRGALPDRASPFTEAIIVLGPVLAILAVGVALQYSYVYRDSGLSHLTSRVDTGAYAGLLTTPDKHRFLIGLEGALGEISGPRCRILFYDDFPAGYLLGHGRAYTNRPWILDVVGPREASYERLLLDYYAKRRTLPDVAVRVNRFPGPDMAAPIYRASDPLERLFTGRRYVIVSQRDDYRISMRTGSTCR